MIEYVERRDQIARLILTHVAQNGFVSLDRFSHLAREIKVGRSLLYFYFKGTSEVIEAIGELFERELAAHLLEIRARALNFKDYLEYLGGMKELAFFALECRKELSRRPELERYLELVHTTIDRYSYEQFLRYYELDQREDMRHAQFMYSCFRSRWWESLASFESWDQASRERFFTDLDGLMSSLKEQDKDSLS